MAAKDHKGTVLFGEYDLNIQDLVNDSDDHIHHFRSDDPDEIWPGGRIEPLEAWPSTELKTLIHAVTQSGGFQFETTWFFEHEVKRRVMTFENR